MTAAERIGLWVLTNLGQPDEPDTETVDAIIERLGQSSVPSALDAVAYDVALDAAHDATLVATAVALDAAHDATLYEAR